MQGSGVVVTTPKFSLEHLQRISRVRALVAGRVGSGEGVPTRHYLT